MRLRRLLCGKPTAFRQAAEPKEFNLKPAVPKGPSPSAQQAAEPRFFHSFVGFPHSGAAKPPDSELQLSYSHFSREAATKIRLAQAFEVCEAGNDS